MCGIVGFIGKRQAAPILLQGLSKLEYRGYDSAGLAIQSQTNIIQTVKAKGRLYALFEKTQSGTLISGRCGIGHTRWATHGEPSEVNAHPHVSADGKVVLVHNGIIENYAELKKSLLEYGYAFSSQTDTEVIANLLSYYLKEYNNCPLAAWMKFIQIVRGSYALAVLFQDFPNEIYAIRKESPLIIGVGNGETFIASDVSALAPHTKEVYFMEDFELARVSLEGIRFYDSQGKPIKKNTNEISWCEEVGEKGAYRHFMHKEIHEQPQAVQKTLQWLEEQGDAFFVEEMQEIDQIYLVACGSAYHAGVAMQYVMEQLANIPTRAELASEFRYRNPLLTPKTLVVIISQSGETADSLAALREAKKRGVKTLAIVNVQGSSIAREADHVFYTQAGPEIAVATTKAYSAQLVCGYYLALELAKTRGSIEIDRYNQYKMQLHALSQKIREILEEEEIFKEAAVAISSSKDVFFIGRGMDYAVSLEGSLKMKEISYLHSEAYAAGELKHGTLSLVEDGVWAIGILTQPCLYEKTQSNIQEIQSRGGKILAVTNMENVEGVDFLLHIPQTEACFSASLAVIPLQFLAYYVSVAKGLDVDKPRNLAKSVTVE